MTPVESLPAAGRDLDLAVTLAIFGPWDESRCRICGWSVVSHDTQGCWSDNCSTRPQPAVRADEPPPFSTDIAAAWRLVERLTPTFTLRRVDWAMRDRGDGVTYMQENAYHNGWWAVATEEGGEYSFAETAPHAICLAALKAVAP